MPRKKRVLMFYLLIVVAAASRFLPHPPNVACVGALGMFAGCYLVGLRAYLVPLAVLLISDVIGQALSIPGMGFYSPLAMAMVYAGAIAAVPIGRWIAKSQRKWRLPAGSLVASSVFFLLSNFGVWMAGWYPMTLTGLISCYTYAVPFFGYTIAGDLAFTAILFGVWEWSRQSVPARSSQLLGSKA